MVNWAWLMYRIIFTPRALKDLKKLPPNIRARIVSRIEALGDNLKGDVKRLRHHQPEYRLRVGVYRVLFELESGTVTIYRVQHRKDAYR
jgi:mRNA interferase RelE/StbE